MKPIPTIITLTILIIINIAMPLLMDKPLILPNIIISYLAGLIGVYLFSLLLPFYKPFG